MKLLCSSHFARTPGSTFKVPLAVLGLKYGNHWRATLEEKLEENVERILTTRSNEPYVSL